MNNEETIIQSQPLAKKSSDTPSEVTIPQPEGKKEKKGVNAWKYVTLGGVSGILMGAGLLHAGQLSAKQLEAEDSTEEDSTTSYTAENGLRVAEVDQNLSFGEAFEAARAEVGPGGVFQWHGGLYNTYTGDEWENMTPDERNDFAQLITPEVMPEDIPAPTDMQPDIAINPQTDQTFAEEGFMTDGDMASEDVMMVGMQEEGGKDEDVTVLSQEEVEAGFGGEDVHIVGYSEVEGHLAVGYDINGDNQADDGKKGDLPHISELVFIGLFKRCPEIFDVNSIETSDGRNGIDDFALHHVMVNTRMHSHMERNKIAHIGEDQHQGLVVVVQRGTKAEVLTDSDDFQRVVVGGEIVSDLGVELFAGLFVEDTATVG